MYGVYMVGYYKLSIRRELVDFVMSQAEKAGLGYKSRADAVHDSLRVLAREMQEQSNSKRSLKTLEKEVTVEEGSA